MWERVRVRGQIEMNCPSSPPSLTLWGEKEYGRLWLVVLQRFRQMLLNLFNARLIGGVRG